MKRRILTHLYGLSKGLKSSEPYLDVIKKETKFSDFDIRVRANAALHDLLHNYHYFTIETIDSFFQRIFRNLTHELQLPSNLRIDLNDKQVEQKAVEHMIDSLKQDDKLLKWIMQFIKENIDEDKSWNVIKQIKLFGENIFKQVYKDNAEQISDALSDDKKFETFRQQMRQMYADAKDLMRERGERFFEILSANGIEPDELNGKSNSIASYFSKLKNGILGGRQFTSQNTINKHLDSPDNWAAKTSKRRNEIIELATTSLLPLLEETEKERTKLFAICNSVELTQRNLSCLRLLENISSEVNKDNQEAGRFLLSNTQDLLNRLIDDSDSPFIFEKIGGSLHHIMIDEFQDTSTLQWDNFKVLINECISHEDSSCLLVGDVKQSIYRWRNGDWQLLNNIEQQFSNSREHLKITPLKTNYRSLSRIVAFNNIFFERARNAEFASLEQEGIPNAEIINSAYQHDELWQEPKNNDNAPLEGRVRLTFIGESDYDQATLDAVRSIVSELLDKGCKPSEIAILTRSNKQITAIANDMMQNMPEVPVVSAEAFLLKSSKAVQLMLEILYHLSHSDDVLSKVSIAKSYQHEILGARFDDQQLMLDEEIINKSLPKEFVEQFNQLQSMPLYDLVEQIYRIFDIKNIEGQGAYISTFFDVVQDFLSDNISDIESFLQAWDDSLYKKSAQINEAEGVRLLTIHRSKGLEFEHVILPFCDWQNESNRDIIWCKTDVMPFAQLPVIPILRSGQKTLASVYAGSYKEESLQSTIDNLNLLYVAFTRAVKTLDVICNDKKTSGRSALIKTVLGDGSLFENSVQTTTDNNTIFEWGEWETIDCADGSELANTADDNVFSRESKACYVPIENYQNRTEFKESNASRRFVSDEENNYIDIGTILHNLLSEIITLDDIDKVIKKYQNDGLLSEMTIPEAKVRALLSNVFRNTEVKKWFERDNIVLNEKTILTKNRAGIIEEYRPDRIILRDDKIRVIDYKFGKPQTEHHYQVQQYISLIKEMGYENVQGCLWYVYQNKVVAV